MYYDGKVLVEDNSVQTIGGLISKVTTKTDKITINAIIPPDNPPDFLSFSLKK